MYKQTEKMRGNIHEMIAICNWELEFVFSNNGYGKTEKYKIQS